MVSFDPHQSFETYYFEIDPGTTYSGEPHQGEIYEYVFVTRGIVEIIIEDKSFTIHENEFLKFEANHHHKYRAIGDMMAAAIMQLNYSL
jgi:mannose-6-phosphate isomerase-like protein (cupin superfamily)